VPEAVSRGALQVGERHAADEVVTTKHSDSAEAGPAAEQGGLVNRSGVGDRLRAGLEGVARDLRGRDRAGDRGGHRGGHSLE